MRSGPIWPSLDTRTDRVLDSRTHSSTRYGTDYCSWNLRIRLRRHEMNAVDPKRPAIATRLLAGVAVPDTPVISRAIEYARKHSEPYLFNHVMRSWLFAVLLAQLNQSVHDAEVLAVTTILHDLGLAKAFGGPLRF